MNRSARDANALLCAIWADLLQAFWDERGDGARYRVTRVGVDWFAEQIGALGQLPDYQTALDKALELIREEGIAEAVEYDLRNDFADFAVLRVRGCALHAGEMALKERGCKTFACLLANLAMELLERIPEISTELASVNVDENGCVAQIVFFHMPD